MRIRNILISIVIVILLVGAGWAYWYFLMGPSTAPASPSQGETGTSPTFRPLPGRGGSSGSAATSTGSTSIGTTTRPVQSSLPVVRLLSSAPVGGYGASTTKATTTVRWIDRGRGNVYEASLSSAGALTLSNTVVPRIVASVWNKDLTAFIGSMFEDGDETPTTVYAQLSRQKAPAAQGTSTSIGGGAADIAPFELKGKDIPGSVIGYAASPDRTKVFLLMKESGAGVGYIASFDGKNMSKLFSTPMTELNVDWPTASTITIATKASASYDGYMYAVNAKTGAVSKLLGPIRGLSGLMSHDGKRVAYSYPQQNGTKLMIQDVSTGESADAVIQTLADKCAWGNVSTDALYCAVPSQQAAGTYPDDWYRGTISSADKIWEVSASSGAVHVIAPLISQADRIINGFRLGLDPKDQYLFFMNKIDLSLWSLDLVRAD